MAEVYKRCTAKCASARRTENWSMIYHHPVAAPIHQNPRESYLPIVFTT
jgi:hypothetical protein